MSAAYLDWNATAPLRPEVQAAMAGVWGNPSSVHRLGRAARQKVESARAQLARAVGADPADVIFTSGATEANNLAIRGTRADSLITSSIEHDSIQKTAAETTLPHAVAPVGPDGRLDLAALAALLDRLPKPALVAVMLVNHETGVIQPIPAIAELVHAAGGKLLVDAVQGFGKIPIQNNMMEVDLMTLSAHKIGGPSGIGALIARGNPPFVPLMTGGGQESGRRAGTENLAGIVGFGVAAELAAAEQPDQAALVTLRERLETGIRAIAAVPIYGAEADRVSSTSLIAMPGVKAETQVAAFDLDGILVSAGSACSSGKVRASPVLAAMGVPEQAAGEAVRVSFGWTTTAAEIDQFLAAWRRLYERTRKIAA